MGGLENGGISWGGGTSGRVEVQAPLGIQQHTLCQPSPKLFFLAEAPLTMAKRAFISSAWAYLPFAKA